MSITIRPYQNSDREAVEGICVDTSQGFERNPLMMEALLQVYCHYYIEREPENCFVAADQDNRAVGYILCAENFTEWERHFQEDYQRQGLGTRLMDQLLAYLKAKGIGGVMLCAVADNEKGINFYHKYGFMELERTKQEIMMGKKLADPSDRTGEPANANEKGV